MKYLKIVCCSSEIVFATDSERIYNYFLMDQEQVAETIPGIKRVPMNYCELERNCIIYSSKEPSIVKLDPVLNQAIICVPEEKLYLPDLIYLMLSMLAKELNNENKYFMHCAIVKKNNKATLIVGEPGSGKTTLAMYLCMNKGYKFVCNDRAIIGMHDRKPFVYSGTLQTHIRLGVIHEYFPQLINQIEKEKLELPWENKIFINPEFEHLGVKVSHTAFVNNILFINTYPVGKEETTLLLQKKDVATLLIMKYLSEYIRAGRNVVLSTNFPFPSFDTQKLALNRMEMVNTLVNQTKIFSAKGNIKILADMIDKELYECNSDHIEKGDNINFLGKKMKVVMDRPLGSKHPQWGFVYPLNYGYIPNTISGDGEELDAYVIGEFNPLTEFEGVCIAIIHRLNDDDDKLIIASEDGKYSKEQIEALTEFQEKYFEHIIIDKRDICKVDL